MKKCLCVLSSLLLGCSLLVGCSTAATDDNAVQLGVSFGAGPAVRWDMEKIYMEEKAAELGANIEVRLNRTDEPLTQTEDCIEMIDNGIDALILMPRSKSDVNEIYDYAKEKGVPVISYSRCSPRDDIALYVGYDCNRIGQRQGQYLTEIVPGGDYILLQGEENDSNTPLLYEGAMRYIEQLGDDVHIILDTHVENWNPDVAKELVKAAVQANGNQVDAILSPNDALAGGAAAALAELGITKQVPITGMDAELGAVHRILDGTQDSTIYMDLRELANTAVEEAYNLATGESVNVNAEFDNGLGTMVPSNLIAGQLVTKENLDKVLIDSGYYTYEEVYGTKAE